MVNQCRLIRWRYIFWDELIFWEGNVICGINIVCIPTTDATVENSTNLYWVMLGLRCWSVYDTDFVCNGLYWHFVIIVDSGIPIWSISWELWTYIIGNTIISYLGEYIYGLGWMFVDLIIQSLNHYIMMVVYWLYYPSQHTREIFTNSFAGYYQFFLTKSTGKYYFSINLTVSIYYQIL